MSESFFGFDEDDEQPGRRAYRRSPWRWVCAVIILVALVGTGLLLFTGVRTIQEASANEAYVGHSWVIQGTYENLTHDLETKSYNAVYEGTLPQDSNMSYHPFDGGIKDPQTVKAGDSVLFRGTQTGSESSDFPQTVDALLALDGGEYKVVRTTEVGKMSPINQEGIDAQQRNGWFLVTGGVLVLVAGTAGALWSVRRIRRDERAQEGSLAFGSRRFRSAPADDQERAEVEEGAEDEELMQDED